ncbi:hypothetical protein K443DRAFT_474640 [Laccaria amethystina LaAM-08-1]|uniref:Uncharacterized protein n=1 Tax=Laccaria amethystina LaAM-08-1 TaxID=1095629 RepID=A0A0C9X595_9AGAR|nr:hypothetical protein K443DRAFT_474640 [Laccaria amethystina LaAM-08-1]
MNPTAILETNCFQSCIHHHFSICFLKDLREMFSVGNISFLRPAYVMEYMLCWPRLYHHRERLLGMIQLQNARFTFRFSAERIETGVRHEWTNGSELPSLIITYQCGPGLAKTLRVLRLFLSNTKSWHQFKFREVGTPLQVAILRVVEGIELRAHSRRQAFEPRHLAHNVTEELL